EGREARRTQEVGLRAAILQRVRSSSLAERLSNEERTALTTCTRAMIGRTWNNGEDKTRVVFRHRIARHNRMKPDHERPTSAGKPDKLAELEPALAKLITRLQERFAEELLAVALYGSYARGEAGADSDVDLMVVVRHLPVEWTDIFAREASLVRVGQDLGIRL